MPTDKRARQKELRQARLEAIRAEERAAVRRRQSLYAVIGVAIVALLVVIAITRSGGDDDGQQVSTATTVTTAPDDGSADPSGTDDTTPAEAPCTQTTPTTRPTPFDMNLDGAVVYSAVVETDVGSFTIEFDAAKAPKAVNNFVNLARAGFYNCVKFHRVIPDFVVQGGDAVEGSGAGNPGYRFEDELPQAGEYEIGSVAMANSGANTNGSQFFIVTGAQGAQLPPNYTLFGKVTEGMETVKAIEADGTAGGTPTVTHYMITVTIEEN